MKRFTSSAGLVLLLVMILPSCQQRQEIHDRIQLASVIEKHMRTEVLDKWYPMAIDEEYGGFLSTFTYDFKPEGPQDKMIVTQARHTWSNAKATELYPDVVYYATGARHGFHFLRDVMWDKVNGGFRTLVDREGKPKSTYPEEKTAYGNAFGIYGLAAYCKVSGDSDALAMAKKAFDWMEVHSHDPIYKGYYQHMMIDGTPIVRDSTVLSTAQTGYKDQNSSIHLLEALTELYSVWPDTLVRERLQEMLFLIRDTIVTPKGYLTLFLTPDWTPVSFRNFPDSVIEKHHNLDHVSFGHDIETAYLMLESSHALGLKNDTITMQVAKRMVDHALENGWDDTVGGFYDEGYYFKDKPGITITHDTKNWWAQAEGLNSLLLMADLYPDDPHHYYEKFLKQWQYCDTYLIDHVNGDWYEGGLDKQPEKKTSRKGHIWKGNYHQFRSLMNVMHRLRGEVDDGSSSETAP